MMASVVELGTLPFRMVWISVICGHVWMVHVAAQLHRHDVLTYARVMTEALEDEDSSSEFMSQVKQLEAMVTARLRQASATWVRQAVLVIATCVLLFLALAMALLVG